MKYKNLWHENHKEMEPYFETAGKLVAEYKRVQVYKIWKERFDYVYKGACITQRTGYKAHKEIIDSLLNLSNELMSDVVKMHILDATK